ALDELARAIEVFDLDLDRAHLTAARKLHAAPAGDVVGDLADRADRVLEREVAHHRALFDHAQHEIRRADLQKRRVLAHVGVADDHVETAVSLRVRVWLIARVDDRTAPGRRRRHAFPY